jgi:hypothetical protein
MIMNINPHYGDSVEFENVSEMRQAILACGFEVPSDGLREGRDYVYVAEYASEHEYD